MERRHSNSVRCTRDVDFVVVVVVSYVGLMQDLTAMGGAVYIACVFVCVRLCISGCVCVRLSLWWFLFSFFFDCLTSDSVVRVTVRGDLCICMQQTNFTQSHRCTLICTRTLPSISTIVRLQMIFFKQTQRKSSDELPNRLRNEILQLQLKWVEKLGFGSWKMHVEFRIV